MAHQNPQSIVELFHMVKSLIPESQSLVTVTPNETVEQVIVKMREGGFSQIPVVSGNAVLDVISYRSLVDKLMQLGPIDTDFRQLPVSQFMEHPEFVQSSDQWSKSLDYLDREDFVLVGHRDDLQGVLTPMDVLNYLHRLASPFIMLAEIETSLRKVIESCVTPDTLNICILNSLKSKYDSDAVPGDLSAMTFNDYAQIIGDGRNWPHFEKAFGPGDWIRKTTRHRLEQVRDLRNDVFHFKREISESDRTTLTENRNWLETVTRTIGGQHQVIGSSSAEPESSTEPSSKRKLDRSSFLKRCNAEGRAFFEWLWDEAEAAGCKCVPYTKNVSIRAPYKGRLITIAYMKPQNTIDIFTDYNNLTSHTSNLDKRREVWMSYLPLETISKFTLRAHANQHNHEHLKTLFARYLREAVVFSEYPVPIRHVFHGANLDAFLLDVSGRVLYNGNEYNSVSTAGGVASNGNSVNGWTFWQYYNEEEQAWRPIDDFRKAKNTI